MASCRAPDTGKHGTWDMRFTSDIQWPVTRYTKMCTNVQEMVIKSGTRQEQAADTRLSHWSFDFWSTLAVVVIYHVGGVQTLLQLLLNDVTHLKYTYTFMKLDEHSDIYRVRVPHQPHTFITSIRETAWPLVTLVFKTRNMSCPSCPSCPGLSRDESPV